MSGCAECPELELEVATQDGLLELLSRLPQITSDAAQKFCDNAYVVATNAVAPWRTSVPLRRPLLTELAGFPEEFQK